MTDDKKPETIDLLVHSRERINAAPAVLWPYIVGMNWMEYPKLVPISGEPGQIGERFAGHFDEALEVAAYYVVNVELTPNRRRTMRIEGLDNIPMGFTTFELIPNGAETIAMYDVNLRAPLPEGMSAEEMLSVSRKGGDDALRLLKNVVGG